MAIYHLSVKPLSRSGGRSAVAAAAYRSGERLHDPRQDLEHDYTRRGGVEAIGLVGWSGTRQELWGATELVETRKNARLAVEAVLALPCELTPDARNALTASFGQELAAAYRTPVDFAIHAPGREGDERNYHAHLLIGCRHVGEDGTLTGRVVPFDGPDQVEHWRERWAEHVNRALEHAQVPDQVDHRSHERRGLEDEPTQHLGIAAAAMERRELREAAQEDRAPEPQTRIGQLNADRAAGNAERAGIRERLAEVVRGWADSLREGWQAVQERLGLAQAAQAAQERREAAKAAQEPQEALQGYYRVLQRHEREEARLPDQEDRDRLGYTRLRRGSDEVIVALRREIIGPACQVLLDARDGRERPVLPAAETPDQVRERQAAELGYQRERRAGIMEERSAEAGAAGDMRNQLALRAAGKEIREGVWDHEDREQVAAEMVRRLDAWLAQRQADREAKEREAVQRELTEKQRELAALQEQTAELARQFPEVSGTAQTQPDKKVEPEPGQAQTRRQGPEMDR